MEPIILEAPGEAQDPTPMEVKDEPYSKREDGTLLCNVCGKIYKQLGYMKKHLTSNHNIQDLVSFFCRKCNKVFDTKKKLTRHETMKGDCSKH